MDQLFKSCGYAASFLGTLIEGDILLLTSVISAKLGYFNYFGGMIAAFFGAFIRDSLQFSIVKKYGKKLLENKPDLQSKLEKSSIWYDKRPLFYMTFYRIMYGFSTPIILLTGLKGVSYRKFALHSGLAVFIWITLIGGFGYFFAEVMIESLSFLKTHSFEVISIMALLGIIYWFFVKRPYNKYCFEP